MLPRRRPLPRTDAQHPRLQHHDGRLDHTQLDHVQLEHATVPTGAGTATTGDVDLDGRPDTVWLTSAPARTLGITTATGATSSTTFTDAAPQAASALGQKLQPAGPAIVLLNTGRSVELHTVVDCQLVPTRNQLGVDDPVAVRARTVGCGNARGAGEPQ